MKPSRFSQIPAPKLPSQEVSIPTPPLVVWWTHLHALRPMMLATWWPSCPMSSLDPPHPESCFTTQRVWKTTCETVNFPVTNGIQIRSGSVQTLWIYMQHIQHGKLKGEREVLNHHLWFQTQSVRGIHRKHATRCTVTISSRKQENIGL